MLLLLTKSTLNLIYESALYVCSKFIALMLFGFRVSAIKIISKEVIQDIGLVGMGTMALKHSGGEIKKVSTQLCLFQI